MPSFLYLQRSLFDARNPLAFFETIAWMNTVGWEINPVDPSIHGTFPGDRVNRPASSYLLGHIIYLNFSSYLLPLTLGLLLHTDGMNRTTPL